MRSRIFRALNASAVGTHLRSIGDSQDHLCAPSFFEGLRDRCWLDPTLQLAPRNNLAGDQPTRQKNTPCHTELAQSGKRGRPVAYGRPCGVQEAPPRCAPQFDG